MDMSPFQGLEARRSNVNLVGWSQPNKTNEGKTFGRAGADSKEGLLLSAKKKTNQ
jgi:hypothetical protein